MFFLDGDYIIRENDREEYCGFIANGTVRAESVSSGAEGCELGMGCVFGVNCLLIDDARHTESIIALSFCRILKLEAIDFEEVEELYKKECVSVKKKLQR